MAQEMYYEQHVKRKNPPMDKLIRGILIVMTGILFVLFALLVNLYFFVPFVMFGLLSLWYFRESRKEFDYILNKNELSVAKISGGRSRRELFTLDLKEQLVVMAPSKTGPVEPWVGKKMKTWDCTSHEEVPYYCMIMRDEHNTEYKALFEPDEELLARLKWIEPQKVHRQAGMP